jgi:hypothetical protein
MGRTAHLVGNLAYDAIKSGHWQRSPEVGRTAQA